MRSPLPVLVVLLASLACRAPSELTGTWEDTVADESGRPRQRLQLHRNGEFKLTKGDGSATNGTWTIDGDKVMLQFSDVRLYPNVVFFQLQDDRLVQIRLVREGSVVLRRAN
jgi:hypothetical protein